jgi:maleate cis-trans isomerase
MIYHIAALTAARECARMFEQFVPKLKIGTLKPLSVIDLSAYEFYRLAPPGVMLIMIGVGLGKFSKEDVERVFAPLETYMDQLVERGADLVMQSGVPLPLLLGVEGHDRLIERMAKRSGKPATSSVLGVVAAAKHLGLRRIVVANKWSDPMNSTLGEFFARGETEIVGAASEVLVPEQFQKIAHDDHMALAYELGRAAFTRHPEADGLYIGGGSWLSAPVCQALEREFGKPAICNATAMVFDTLTRLGHWAPILGQGRLLESA